MHGKGYHVFNAHLRKPREYNATTSTNNEKWIYLLDKWELMRIQLKTSVLFISAAVDSIFVTL